MIELCVSTMHQGEVATVQSQPQYSAGLSSAVPANAELKSEIECVSWSGEDISKRKDGGIRRSIIEAGQGQVLPNIGASCQVHIVGRVGDREFENRDVTFVLGEGSEVDILAAVEYAIGRMKQGAKIRLAVKSLYVNQAEYSRKHSLPADVDVTYEIELLSFSKAKECWELDNGQKMEEAAKYKERGTGYFKEDKFKLAKLNYKKVVEFLGFVPHLSEGDRRRWTDLLIAGHLNLAICYLKLEDFVSARDSCSAALEHDPVNEKALYRRGLANFHLQDFKLALRDLEEVLKLNPQNVSARQQLHKVKAKMSQSTNKDRELYSRMFDRFAEQDSKREGTSQPIDVFSSPGEWSNEMAKDMMTLEQEMAAFGERLPEAVYDRRQDKENLDPGDD